MDCGGLGLCARQMHAAPAENRDQSLTPSVWLGSAQLDELNLKGQGLLQSSCGLLLFWGVSLWKGGRGRVMDEGTYFS